jgi:hypothetical protein
MKLREFIGLGLARSGTLQARAASSPALEFVNSPVRAREGPEGQRSRSISESRMRLPQPSSRAHWVGDRQNTTNGVRARWTERIPHHTSLSRTRQNRVYRRYLLTCTCSPLQMPPQSAELPCIVPRRAAAASRLESRAPTNQNRSTSRAQGSSHVQKSVVSTAHCQCNPAGPEVGGFSLFHCRFRKIYLAGLSNPGGTPRPMTLLGDRPERELEWYVFANFRTPISTGMQKYAV